MPRRREAPSPYFVITCPLLRWSRSLAGGEVLKCEQTLIVQDGAEAHFSISWFEDTFHRVMIRSIKPGTGQWLVRHSYELGLSEAIDDWLKASRRFGDVRWYSEVEWEARRAGQERPW